MFLPVVQPVHGKPLGLLLAMVCGIQHGLQALTEAFCRPPATKRGKGQIPPRDGPNLRVEMPYIYLMAWFALHCPAIIQPGEELLESVHFAHLCLLEGSQWLWTYIAGMQKLVRHYDAYRLYMCFPSIPGARYGEEFFVIGDERSSLRQGVFKWLMSIRSSHLVYRCSDIC